MKSGAAVAFEAGKPLEIVEIDVAPPRKGEVLIRVTHTGVCHTDAYTLAGSDPEGVFRLFWATRARASLSRSVKASPASGRAIT
ncbi:S-(hydroxymethyl)glutathione dehydrogenase/alcohol dehydrogenase [Croceicoccus naphthovorans]|uniref:Uncharacterized protein n=1 Tax=Croceicoccus naphthovorans TaxID=1348774 RepID=A0A0G3XI55_9SPHN|nr:hypothetical protein AB433_10650 [Croceicoccus naphthovorans]MBB3989982.1 S-(hydroxymethyl)glutathione dehydrogenase/alcohol dehydrogenase [Croceicoccus naphthovorans]